MRLFLLLFAQYEFIHRADSYCISILPDNLFVMAGIALLTNTKCTILHKIIGPERTILHKTPLA